MAEQTVPSPLDPVAVVVARDEIRQLAYEYAWALDSRDIDRLVSLFVDDVRVTADVVGREALRASFREQLRTLGPTTLFVGNHLITVEAHDRATGIVYCRGYIQESTGFIEQMIVYSDRYRRDADRWRFVGRRHELFYGVPTAEAPHAQPQANWPDHSVGIGTLPFRLDSWRAFEAETAPSEPE